MGEGSQSEDVAPDPDSYDWITVMDGPGVSGKGRIWFGRVTEPWEVFNEDMEIVTRAEPVQYVPVPRPMTRPELEDWLEQDGRGENYLEQF